MWSDQCYILLMDAKMTAPRLADVVAREIEQRVLEGRLKPGDRLPSERDLSVQLGVSPRGAAALLAASKAWAWLSGRPYVTADEVKAVARPVLRHRIMVRPELELEGSTADGILDVVLSSVPVPR